MGDTTNSDRRANLLDITYTEALMNALALIRAYKGILVPETDNLDAWLVAELKMGKTIELTSI